MIYYIIDYNSLYTNIEFSIVKFCNKFEIDFFTQKIKTKKQLLIYYTIIELLQIFQKNKIEKPIIVFQKKADDRLLQFCLNTVSNILIVPIYNCEKFDDSEGLKQELYIKADKFYEKNVFTTKKLEKLLKGENFDKLILKVKQFKLPVKSPQKEHTSV
jgi:hypothetical protein